MMTIVVKAIAQYNKMSFRRDSFFCILKLTLTWRTGWTTTPQKLNFLYYIIKYLILKIKRYFDYFNGFDKELLKSWSSLLL